MDAIINLQGIKVHVGFFRQGSLYKVDEADCYITDKAGQLLAQIDDIDAIGELTATHGWQSLRTLAEEHANEHAAEWDRAAALQAHADAVAERQVA